MHKMETWTETHGSDFVYLFKKMHILAMIVLFLFATAEKKQCMIYRFYQFSVKLHQFIYFLKLPYPFLDNRVAGAYTKYCWANAGDSLDGSKDNHRDKYEDALTLTPHSERTIDLWYIFLDWVEKTQTCTRAARVLTSTTLSLSHNCHHKCMWAV